jgi:Yip1 domain
MSVEITSEEPSSRFSGLLTYFSIIFSPKAAFDRLSRVPTWGWAALLGIVLTLVAVILTGPAQLHMAATMQQQRIAQMPADQQAQARSAMAMAAGFTKVSIYVFTLIVPWFAWLLSAVVLLIAAALGGGEAKFARAWVASVNAYVIIAIAGIINAIIVALRDPTTVNSPADMATLPSLALLFHDSPKAAAFFAAYNVLYIWYYVVAVIALERVLKVSRPVAIATVVIYSLIWALLAMAAAR